MARLLIVDDDQAQLDLWTFVFARAGHDVRTATTRPDAVGLLLSFAPDVLVMDLGLPAAAEGEKLMAEARRVAPSVRILLLSGAPEQLADEAAPDEVMRKPVLVEHLLDAIARLAMVLLVMGKMCSAQVFSFETARTAEVIADLELSARGAEWALAELVTDGSRAQQVLIWDGERPRRYGVFLGRLEAGPHTMEVRQAAHVKAHGAGFREIAREDQEYAATAHAPVLYAREDTVGALNDAPLLMYCERLGDVLQYTAVFSNEDGGTSTRALMARWGRTTDIEYIYRHHLKSGRATIQAKDHKEVAFTGRYDGSHPILIPVTKNNMVAAEGQSAVRYQIAPLAVDLTSATRESVMDAHPATYRAMARELEREGKVRPFGAVEGEKISDPRNYLYLDLLVRNDRSAVGVLARLRGDRTWRSSHLGRHDYAIGREGWVRTAVELPPGARANDLEEMALECLVAAEHPPPVAGACRVESVSKVFLLDPAYIPGPNLAPAFQPLTIPTGAAVSVPFRIR